MVHSLPVYTGVGRAPAAVPDLLNHTGGEGGGQGDPGLWRICLRQLVLLGDVGPACIRPQPDQIRLYWVSLKQIALGPVAVLQPAA